tara:strand:- start:2751 stop:2855 length:105 start_codon:yes stop_codon:yes gene_type:complete
MLLEVDNRPMEIARLPRVPRLIKLLLFINERYFL